MRSYILGAGAVGSQFAARGVLAGFLIGTVPALAAVEQCRFIQAKPEREACYQRQEASSPRVSPSRPRRHDDAGFAEADAKEDDEVYKSLRSICRGC